MVNGQKLALFLLLAILVNVVHSRRKNNNDDVDNDDDDYNDDDGDEDGGRHKCTSEEELQSCNTVCDEHRECTRYSYDLECDDVCRFVCRYIDWNKTRKCIINLTGGLQDSRDNDRGGKKGGGQQGDDDLVDTDGQPRGRGGGGGVSGGGGRGRGGGGAMSREDNSGFSPSARAPKRESAPSTPAPALNLDLFGGLLGLTKGGSKPNATEPAGKEGSGNDDEDQNGGNENGNGNGNGKGKGNRNGNGNGNRNRNGNGNGNDYGNGNGNDYNDNGGYGGQNSPSIFDESSSVPKAKPVVQTDLYRHERG